MFQFEISTFKDYGGLVREDQDFRSTRVRDVA